jgi:hypothetical protein
MIPALGAGGPGFDSRIGPFCTHHERGRINPKYRPRFRTLAHAPLSLMVSTKMIEIVLSKSTKNLGFDQNTHLFLQALINSPEVLLFSLVFDM